MDALTFIAKLVEVLAWPATVFGVVLLLRRQIQQLVPLIRKVKAGPVEAEFEREVEKLERTTSPAALPPTPVPASPRKLELFELARSDPRTAILQAWVDVEASALRAVEREALQIPEYETVSPKAAIRAVAKSTNLSAEWVSVYYQLRDLRNKAANEPDFKPNIDPAAAYVELASRLQRQLDQATKRAN